MKRLISQKTAGGIYADAPERTRPLRRLESEVHMQVAVLLLILCSASVAEETPLKPPGRTPAETPTGEDLAETLLKKGVEEFTVDKEHAYRCPICGKPMWQHEGDFECRPPGLKPLKPKEMAAVCPVCGLRFKAFLPSGGAGQTEIDSDFCRHPIGADAFPSTVWLCLRCGYAARHNDFNKPVSDDVKRFVREKMSVRTEQDIRGILRLSDKLIKDITVIEQQYVPEIVMYRNAVSIAEQSGAESASGRAQLYLEGVHASRRCVAGRIRATFLSRGLQDIEEALTPPSPTQRLDLAERTRRLEEALADGRIAGRPLSPATEYCLNVELAGLYDRGGDRGQAEACLNAARAVMPSIPRLNQRNAGILASDLALRQSALRSEAAFAASAIEFYIKAVDTGEIEGHGAFLAHAYLIGDLYRRIAQPRRSRSWFQTISPLGRKLDPSLFAWMERALSRDDLQVPPDPDEAAKAAQLYVRTGADKVVALQPLEAPVERPVETAAETPGQTPAPAVSPAEAWQSRPATCRELMQRFHNSLQAYHHKKGEWPKTLSELADEGFIPRSVVADFTCPETGAKLFYRAPSGAGSFVLFHANPAKCECRNILYSDGAIRKVP